MLKSMLLLFGFALAACTFDTSNQSLGGNDLGTAGGADAGGVGVDVDAGGNVTPPQEDAAPPQVPSTQLISDTAIVRYFINDALFFETPSQVRDAIGNPELNLDIVDPDENASFVNVDSHRGISFSEINASTRLTVPIADSKIHQQLDGSRTGTIELVVDLEDVVSIGSRISHVGTGTDGGLFTLRASDTNTVDFFVNNLPTGRWVVDMSSGRMVIHVVLDTNEVTASERVKLYVDGQRVTPLVMLAPNKNVRISIPTGTGQSYTLGNREIGDRSLQGTFYYAAMYSGAMSADVVAHNATVLHGTDDSSQIVGQ